MPMASTMLAAAGCLPEKVVGGEPRLKVGVLSDVHLLVQKDSMHSDVYFEKALRWYDAQKADAVLLCGDIADCGLVSELEYAAEIWNKVFPGDRRSDGEPIKHLFHFGDHDYGGYAHKYPWAKKCSKDPDAPNHALVNEDVVAIWERLFHEKWMPIQVHEVKGYTFVLAHHPRNLQNGTVIPGLAEALAAANPDPKKPFFYSMHRPVHGTLPEWDPQSLAKDPNHKALCQYPNVMAFFGHCHRNCADELNLWQGEYTVVHVPSTSYCCTRGGRENSFSCGNQPDKKRPQLMDRVDCRTSNQALFMTVLPPSCCAAPPAFPEGAVATVSTRIGKNRAKKEMEQVVVTFPPAHSREGRLRALDYEVTATADNFKLVRRVFPTRAYWCEEVEKEPSTCVFGKFELPSDKPVTFTVRPADSFGVLGQPLPPVTWRAS